MLVISSVLWAWAAACWFTELLPTPFLGIGLLSIPPVVSALCALAASMIFTSLWYKRSGFELIRKFVEFLKARRGEVAAILLILLLHVALEIPAVVMHRGANDWDSSLWGLASYHIADGARPIFGYGFSQGTGETQHYNGTLIPHITAVLHSTFGPNPAYLRMVEAVFFLGFLIAFYVLLRRFIDARPALLTLLFLALPPASVFKLIRHTEYSLLALIGTVALLIANRIAGEEKPGWKRYFSLGLTFGIGYYVIPQIIFFAVSGVVIILLRHRRFFLKPQFWTLPGGFVLGATPAFVDAWYSNGLPFQFFASASTGLMQMIPHAFAGLLESVRLSAWYLGGTYAVSPTAGEDLLPALLTSGLWLLLLAVFIFMRRRELIEVLRGRKPAGIETFLFLAVVTILIFAFSSYSSSPAPYRYLFPLALCIPPMLAVVFEPLFRIDRRIYAVAAVIPVLFFIYTLLFQDLVNSVRQESYFAELEEWLKEEEVDRFYGSFAVVYNLAFSTREEIIGSTAYHWSYDAYEPYTRAVGDSRKQAYFFLPQENDAAAGLIRRLGANGISFSLKRNHLGILVSDLKPLVPVNVVKELPESAMQ